MKINMKVRWNNPIWVLRFIVAVLAPVFAYMGISYQDLTTWQAVLDVITQAISNPYIFGLVIVSVINILQDPTTAGLGDSEQALDYKKPRKSKAAG